jgi:Zn-dependent protease
MPLLPPKPFLFQASWGALVPTALFVIFAVAYMGGRTGVIAGVLLLVCLLLHELGHVVVALVTRTPVHAIGIGMKGSYVRRKAASSPAIEVCIAATGPLVNVALAILLWGRSDIGRWLAEMNAVLAISNLIPVAGSDGQRILKSIREHRSAPQPKPRVIETAPAPETDDSLRLDPSQ